jgi:hypothetical protein
MADDGGCDPAVAQVLADAGLAPEVRTDRLVSALAPGRVMVAVVAVLAEGEQTAHGRSDKQADMALVTLTSPDGRRALPVFSSVQALARWDETARPVAVATRRAAVSAIGEGCTLLVLDPSGPASCELPWSALVALAEGRTWLAGQDDPQVRQAVQAVTAGEPDVVAQSCSAAAGGALRVELTVRAGLSAEQLTGLLDRLGGRLGEDDILRRRTDGIALAVRPEVLPGG